MTDPSTIRRQALEEALSVLPKPNKAMAGLTGVAWSNRAIEDCRAAIQYLLAADPREADKGVEHGVDTPAKTYHDGVRDALAALPERVTSTWDGTQWLRRSDVVAAISALLPQPKDEAEEIVERYCADLGIVPTPDARAVSVAMLRRHLSQGWRAPE